MKTQYLKTRFADILYNNGNFLEYKDILQKLPLRLTFQEYMGLQLAIKNDWQEKIKSHNFDRCPNQGPYMMINKILKPLYKLTSQLLYWELINLKSESPSSLDIWVDLFPFFGKYRLENYIYIMKQSHLRAILAIILV